MIKKCILLAILTTMSFSSQGQSKFINKDKLDYRQHFLVFANYDRYLNERDVSTTWGNKKFLTAHNTNGYKIGVRYEYVNRYNMNFSIATAYGVEHVNLGWLFSFDGFDDRVNLDGIKETYIVKQRLPYLSNNLSIGYDYALDKTKKVKLQCKLGIGSLRYYKRFKENWKQVLLYHFGSNPVTYTGTEYATTMVYVGAETPWWARQRTYYYSAYLGITYNVNSWFAREYRVGIDFTHLLTFQPQFDYNHYADATYYRYANGSLIADGYEEYKSKFRSIAIVGSIGF